MTSIAPPVRLLENASRLGEFNGLRFEIELDGIRRAAIAIRFRGQFYAYVNSCRHQSRELDFGDGHLFDDEADALVCCHHGARYEPTTGRCVSGPCAGAGLTALTLELRDGALWCTGERRCT